MAKISIRLMFVVLVFLVQIIDWVIVTSGRLSWAVDLAGGEAALVRDIPSTLEKFEMDYLSSLRLRPGERIRKKLTAMRSCEKLDTEDECINILLAKINSVAIQGAEVNKISNILEDFRRNESPDLSRCRAKLEIAYLIVAMQGFLENPEYESLLAAYAVKKIREEGGLGLSLRVPECKRYFLENPHIAKVYLGYLALLIGMAEGRYSLGWIYLANRYGSAALIR